MGVFHRWVWTGNESNHVCFSSFDASKARCEQGRLEPTIFLAFTFQIFQIFEESRTVKTSGISSNNTGEINYRRSMKNRQTFNGCQKNVGPPHFFPCLMVCEWVISTNPSRTIWYYTLKNVLLCFFCSGRVVKTNISWAPKIGPPVQIVACWKILSVYKASHL